MLVLCCVLVIQFTGYIQCGEVWYGMVWYGMVWYGMVWYGMVWYGMVWYGMVWYGMVWYGIVWYGMGWYIAVVWYGMVWCGMVWYGLVWYVVWYGMVCYIAVYRINVICFQFSEVMRRKSSQSIPLEGIGRFFHPCFFDSTLVTCANLSLFYIQRGYFIDRSKPVRGDVFHS